MTRPTIDTVRHPDGVHRDRWTRPIYPVPDGSNADARWRTCKQCDAPVPGWPFTRMTKFIGVLDDKRALERWIRRQVLIGTVLKEHLVLKASNAMTKHARDPQAQKNALDDICEEAADAAGQHDAADMGTELHNLLEAIQRGEKVRVPAPFRADVQALHDTMSGHRFTVAPGDLEINVVIDGVPTTKTAYGIGGRFDLVVTTPEPCPGCGLTRRIADYKTGQVWYHGCTRNKPCGQGRPMDCPRRTMYGADEFRMQLAGYAAARRIDPATGARAELGVCQCVGYVVHLPAGLGVCEILEADLARGRQGLREALNVWGWRDGNTPLQPAQIPDVSTSTPNGPIPVAPENLHALIAVAADRDNLLGLRRHFKSHWTIEHDEAARRRVAELEASK